MVRIKAKELMTRAEKIKAYLVTLETVPTTSEIEYQPKKAFESNIVTSPAQNKLSWSDVAGSGPAKTALEEAVVFPVRFPTLFTGNRKPPLGILLYGPPGTGKSLLAKVTAETCNCKFYPVSSSDLVSKHLGDSEKAVKELFQNAKANSPSVIFIDEIDAICSTRREGESESSTRMKTQFLIQMTDLDSSPQNGGVVVLAATNRPFDLDPAVRRRFDRRIYIPLPDTKTRQQLFKIHTGEETELLEKDIDLLTNKTEGFSGSDISDLCRDALMQPVRQCMKNKIWKEIKLNNGEEKIVPCKKNESGSFEMDMMQLSDPAKLILPPVKKDDFFEALKKAKPSVNNKDLKEFEEWTHQFGTVPLTEVHGIVAEEKEKKSTTTRSSKSVSGSKKKMGSAQ
eukprot:TRINITY_DN2743_c0_g1_i1.p1 TRINITY_DN2743_c0_g1~~TRINITY_DN2743_c0_g1_i1.p1  ORF type:complete len:397 (-),score=111.95 TRINITY_DN2743_c0_g1_i1:6-1196(-)